MIVWTLIPPTLDETSIDTHCNRFHSLPVELFYVNETLKHFFEQD